MNVIVDTSVWSLALRRKKEKLNSHERAALGRFTDLIEDLRVVVIGPIRRTMKLRRDFTTDVKSMGYRVRPLTFSYVPPHTTTISNSSHLTGISLASPHTSNCTSFNEHR